MAVPLVLVTGFGPFPGRERNPSREVAALLEREPPPGLRVAARELPVTFLGAPAALRAAQDSLPERPVALLALGVHPEPCFRLERRARGRFDGAREDADGRTATELELDLGPELVSELDLEDLAEALRAAGAGEVRLSDDAGGYVCERTWRALLEAGRELGVPALFLHVPPAEHVAAELQAPLVRALLPRLVARG
jgi:pyroglutamyl-peptidase